MRRDTLKHLSLQALCGAVIGFIAGLTLMSLAVPDPARMIAPPGMLADLERLALLSGFVRKAHWLWTILLLGATASSWLLAAPRISPELGAFPFLQTPKPLKAWAAAAFSGMAALFGTAMILNSFQAGCCSMTGNGPPAYVYVAGGALLWGAAWLILSPMRPVRNAVLGTLAGLAAAGAAYGLKDFFWLLYTLNVELWTYSAEVAFGGTVRNLLICAFIGAAGLASTMGWAAALSAEDSFLSGRLRRAALPLSLCAVLAAGFGALSAYAARRDHGKPVLSRAASLQEGPRRGATAVVPDLDGKARVGLIPWPMEAHASSFVNSSPVPALEENIALLQRFLAERGRRTVFRNAAVNAIPSICLTLWQPGKMAGLYDEVLSGMGPRFGVPVAWTAQRISWLADRAPATGENRRMLERVSASGLRLTEPASQKLAQGRARIDGPAPGVVRGRLRLPGADDAAGVRIGLFLFPAGRPAYSGPPLLQTSIVDSRLPGKDGAFEFDRLTPGEYFLAILVPGEAFRRAWTGASIGRQPGRMRVSVASPVHDAGAIELKIY